MKESKNTKMPRTPLSTPAIKGMKPASKDLSDTGENAGLRVSCGAKGTKSFYYRYRSPIHKDKTVSITFGYYPIMSLSEARQVLQELKAIRKSGRCPKTERDEEKRLEKEQVQVMALEQQAVQFTVTNLVDLYLEEYIEDRMVNGKLVAGARKKKGQSECRRTLYGDAVKQLGEFPAAQVTRKQVVEMVRVIVDRGSKVQAGNVLRELNLAYNYAIGYEYFPDDFINPALAAKEQLKLTNLKLTSTAGDRWLTDNEVRIVLKWLPNSGFSDYHKSIIQLTLWTGMRSGVICQMENHEVDLDAGTLLVPKDKSKTNTDQYIQLPSQAIDFIRQLKPHSSGYYFYSSRTETHIEQKTMTESKWRLKQVGKLTNGRSYKPEERWLDTIEDWAPHDLRRTVRTGLARLGCRREIAEAVIGHSKESLEGTYNLHSYEKDCREWLQIWADHLDTLRGS